jgi:hypothetical protein
MEDTGPALDSPQSPSKQLAASLVQGRRKGTPSGPPPRPPTGEHAPSAASSRANDALCAEPFDSTHGAGIAKTDNVFAGKPEGPYVRGRASTIGVKARARVSHSSGKPPTGAGPHGLSVQGLSTGSWGGLGGEMVGLGLSDAGLGLSEVGPGMSIGGGSLVASESGDGDAAMGVASAPDRGGEASPAVSAPVNSLARAVATQVQARRAQGIEPTGIEQAVELIVGAKGSSSFTMEALRSNIHSAIAPPSLSLPLLTGAIAFPTKPAPSRSPDDLQPKAHLASPPQSEGNLLSSPHLSGAAVDPERARGMSFGNASHHHVLERQAAFFQKSDYLPRVRARRLFTREEPSFVICSACPEGMPLTDVHPDHMGAVAAAEAADPHRHLEEGLFFQGGSTGTEKHVRWGQSPQSRGARADSKSSAEDSLPRRRSRPRAAKRRHSETEMKSSMEGEDDVVLTPSHFVTQAVLQRLLELRQAENASLLALAADAGAKAGDFASASMSVSEGASLQTLDEALRLADVAEALLDDPFTAHSDWMHMGHVSPPGSSVGALRKHSLLELHPPASMGLALTTQGGGVADVARGADASKASELLVQGLMRSIGSESAVPLHGAGVRKLSSASADSFHAPIGLGGHGRMNPLLGPPPDAEMGMPHDHFGTWAGPMGRKHSAASEDMRARGLSIGAASDLDMHEPHWAGRSRATSFSASEGHDRGGHHDEGAADHGEDEDMDDLALAAAAAAEDDDDDESDGNDNDGDEAPATPKHAEGAPTDQGPPPPDSASRTRRAGTADSLDLGSVQGASPILAAARVAAATGPTFQPAPAEESLPGRILERGVQAGRRKPSKEAPSEVSPTFSPVERSRPRWIVTHVWTCLVSDADLPSSRAKRPKLEARAAAEADVFDASKYEPQPIPTHANPDVHFVVHVPKPLHPSERPLGWVGSYSCDARRARILRFLAARFSRITGLEGTARLYLVATKTGSFA